MAGLVRRWLGPEPRLVVRAGWPLSLAALAAAALTALLIGLWAVNIEWLAIRLGVAGAVVLAAGLLVGSSGLVGLATLPALAGAVIGLDRPEGHAWGRALLLAVLWYVAVELAWAAIERRDGTRRTPAVDRLRVQEVATVVTVVVVVGVAGSLLTTVAPVRTVPVRGLAVLAVLAGVVAIGRHLTGRSAPAGGR